MQPSHPWETKVLSAAALAEWRERVRGEPVAVVTGTFDILQPGNLSALRAARRAARQVCVIVEPDDLVASHAEAGRPRNPLPDRAEFLSYLRPVSAVTSIPLAHAGEIFDALRPFIWVTGAERRDGDPFAKAASAAADVRLAVPLVPGCSTDEIHEAIRRGKTPIPLPPRYEADHAPGVEEGPVRPRKPTPRVTVNGCFDILHIGHVRFLAQARALGASLTVLLNDDTSVTRYKGATRPVFPAAFRRLALLALEAVSDVLPFSEDNPLRLMAEIKADIHVKGGTYEEDRVRQERKLMESWGGRLAFCPLVDGYSTTLYIRKILG